MKTSGSWASLLRGVSQQPPEVRQAGQHAEQVNLLADPVAGLTRRRGTVFQAMALLPAADAAQAIRVLTTSGGYRKVEHSSGGKEYVILIRESQMDAQYGNAGRNNAPAVVCYNQTDSVFVPLSTDAVTVARDQLLGRNGVQAVVSLGKYVVHTHKGESYISSAYTDWVGNENNYPVIWIRGGAYNRTYRVGLSTGVSFEYTTPGPAVAGSGDAISPQNIATQLKVAGQAAGFAIGQLGAHIYIDAPSQGRPVLTITVSDGGDGSLMLGLSRTTNSIDKLPLMAVSNSVAKIQTGPREAFYVKAIPKNAATSFGEVIWRESAGEVQGSNVALGLMVIEGGTLRLGASNAIVATAAPQFVASTAGDKLSNPAPAFLRGLPITYLGMFQDRLVVGAGAAVAVSGAGDYFNFFRSSVVTIPIKDGFEMIAQGGEDDVLRYSVSYNRNLVIFGDKRQYLISGQQALTPTSANMSIMTTYADATSTAPVAAGGQIYYARNREGSVGLHQIQPGAFVDSAESFPASAQIGDYIKAPAAQLEVVPGAPSLLMVRSTTVADTVVTFSFLDTPDGRKQDAWSKWKFGAECGSLMAVKSTPNGVLLFWLRYGLLGYYVVCDLMPLSTQLGVNPFLDSMRSIGTVEAGVTEVVTTSGGAWTMALNSSTDRFLIGTSLAGRGSIQAEYPAEYSTAMVGVPFDSYVELTNPFIRDSAQVPVLDGRLVITKLSFNFKNSSGCVATVTSNGVSVDYQFNARVLGDLLNTIGKVPISSTIHTVPVGRETREFKVRIAARKWFPFTIVGIGWTGQSFNRTARS